MEKKTYMELNKKSLCKRYKNFLIYLINEPFEFVKRLSRIIKLLGDDDINRSALAECKNNPERRASMRITSRFIFVVLICTSVSWRERRQNTVEQLRFAVRPGVRYGR